MARLKSGNSSRPERGLGLTDVFHRHSAGAGPGSAVVEALMFASLSARNTPRFSELGSLFVCMQAEYLA